MGCDLNGGDPVRHVRFYFASHDIYLSYAGVRLSSFNACRARHRLIAFHLSGCAGPTATGRPLCRPEGSVIRAVLGH